MPEGGGPRRVLRSLRNALTTYRRATPADIVIYSDSHNLSGSLYGMVHGLTRRRPTFVRTDPLLGPIAGQSVFKKRYLDAALSSVDRFIVWAPDVVRRYGEHYGIPAHKMVPVRFHHTLTGYDFGTIKEGNYLFSGGDSMRDYAALMQAVSNLPIPVIVATRLKLPATLEIPANVTVRSATHVEFRRLMAEAKMVIFPLRTDTIRTSGQQSYLNAMALGKVVIVTDPVDASYYIDNGTSGVLVPAGNPASLRGAIERLLDSPSLRRQLSDNARAAALPLDQETTWSQIIAVARQAHEGK